MSIALRFGVVGVILLLCLSGGKADEEQLKRVIKETIKPRSVEHKPFPADVERLLVWSKPVGGLVSRIEDVQKVWGGSTVFVRLKNVSDAPLSVPTGNPSDKTASRLFDIYVQQGARPWRKATGNGDRYYCELLDTAADQNREYLVHGFMGRPADRPWVTLRSGEDCLALVTGFDRDDSGEAKSIKVFLRQEASEPGRWSGVIETQPRPMDAMELSSKQFRALIGALPFPDHFPPLSYDSSGCINGDPLASAVERFHGSNQPLIDILAIYDPAGVCKEFERRMRVEKMLPMKLLLASVAASAGSEAAALFLLDTMKGTDYFSVINLHHAVWIAYPQDWQKKEPPDWLVELSLAILSDNRLVTGLKKAHWAAGTSFTVASCNTRSLESALGHAKSRKAVPLLIERLKKGDADAAITLGEIGDTQAIPALIELLEAAGKTRKYSKEEGGLSEDFGSPAFALSHLKAREAVPLMLRYVEYPEVIDHLGEIGDPLAIPALREIVAAKGKIIRDGKPVNPELEADRLFTAKLALARLDGDNEVAHLAEMLDDPSVTEHYGIVMRLTMLEDPRAIPHLVKVIKTDLHYRTIDMAISGLSELKYKAAVEGLIECFDVKFREENVGKAKHVTPATYRNLIARSLQRITGEHFGADKQQWLQWWHEKGEQNSKLK